MYVLLYMYYTVLYDIRYRYVYAIVRSDLSDVRDALHCWKASHDLLRPGAWRGRRINTRRGSHELRPRRRAQPLEGAEKYKERQADDDKVEKRVEEAAVV